MKKGLVIFIVLLALIIIGIILFSLTSSNEDQIKGENSENMGDQNQENNAENTEATHYTIDISDFAYNPEALTILVGDSVTWINKDSVAHTVTSDSGSELDSPLLSISQTYSHNFDQAGTYDYYCKPHPYMKGKIIVE